MDKLAKVRAEVERLKGWNNNVRNSTRHMTLQEEDFNRGKHSSYLEILSFIDSLQEEPVKIKKGCKYRCLCDMINKDTGNIAFIGGKIYLAPKDNTLVSEENGWRCDTSENASNFELIEETVSDGLEKASKEWLAPQLDKSYAAYEETKQMELTHFDGYAMLDAIEFGAKWGKNQAMAEIQAQSMAFAHGCPEESESEDMEEACEQLAENARKHRAETSSPFFCQTDYKQGVIDGAKWQKQQDQSTIELAEDHAMLAGMEKMKEEMMSKAIDGIARPDDNEIWCNLTSSNLKDGDKVKVIVIKDE